MRHTVLHFYIAIIFFILWAIPIHVFSQFKPSGFLDFNAYKDTRYFKVVTINTLCNFSPRVEYFSFINLTNSNSSSDLDGYYSKQYVQWAISKKIPLDATLAWETGSAPLKDNLKLVMRWRWNQTPGIEKVLNRLNLLYYTRIHFVQYNENAGFVKFPLMEQFYFWRIFPSQLNNRLYLLGFADQNIIWNDTKSNSTWVSEHQLGIRLIDNFYFVCEYRINQYMKKPNGLGLGVEYKVQF